MCVHFRRMYVMKEKEHDHDDIYQMVHPYPVGMSFLAGRRHYHGVFPTL